jgi:transcriptional regulator with XRE-family HTH domain
MYRDDKIRIAISEKGISVTKLAALAGLTRQTVAPIVDGSAKDPKLSSLTRIANALGIPLPDLFQAKAQRVD